MKILHINQLTFNRSIKTLIIIFLISALSIFVYENRAVRRTLLPALPAIMYKFFGDYQILKTIDKIYILNMERHLERYQRMESVLANLNLPIEYVRFNAQDGKKVKLINIDTKAFITGDKLLLKSNNLIGKYRLECPNSQLPALHINLKYLNPFSIKSGGEIGCFCSHREIWNDILLKGYKRVMILESVVKLELQKRW